MNKRAARLRLAVQAPAITTTEQGGTQSARERASPLNRLAIRPYLRSAMNQEQFWKRYNTLEEQCNCLSDRLAKLQSSVKERKQRADVISGFMFEIKERDGIIDEFDEELWTALLESVTITRDGKWQFKFKNERVIEV